MAQDTGIGDCSSASCNEPTRMYPRPACREARIPISANSRRSCPWAAGADGQRSAARAAHRWQRRWPSCACASRQTQLCETKVEARGMGGMLLTASCVEVDGRQVSWIDMYPRDGRQADEGPQQSNPVGLSRGVWETDDGGGHLETRCLQCRCFLVVEQARSACSAGKERGS